VDKKELEDKLGRQSCNAKIESFHPERRDADDQARDSRHDAGTRKRKPEGKAKAGN